MFPAAFPAASSGAWSAASSEASGSDEPILPTGDVVLPVIIKKVDPDYPDIARRARIEGKVILQAVIDKEGNVNEVTVLSSSNPHVQRFGHRGRQAAQVQAGAPERAAGGDLLHDSRRFQVALGVVRTTTIQGAQT